MSQGRARVVIYADSNCFLSKLLASVVFRGATTGPVHLLFCVVAQLDRLWLFAPPRAAAKLACHCYIVLCYDEDVCICIIGSVFSADKVWNVFLPTPSRNSKRVPVRHKMHKHITPGLPPNPTPTQTLYSAPWCNAGPFWLLSKPQKQYPPLFRLYQLAPHTHPVLQYVTVHVRTAIRGRPGLRTGPQRRSS